MTRKLRITHFGKFYPPEFGGIESVTAALAQDHAGAGHHINIICFTTGASRTTSDGSLRITRRRILANLASQPISLGYLVQALTQGRKADIVHVHAPNILASLAALLMPRRVKLLIHWHADISGKGSLGALARPIEKLLLWRADVIVCTSQRYADSSPALKPFRSKIRIIPIGIPNVSNETAENPPENLPFDWMLKRPIILAVGRLVRYKGFFVLLEAMSKIDVDTTLVIVGVGPLHKQLMEKIEQLNLANRVWLLGRQSTGNLTSMFAHSDLFCLPSVDRAEAFGVVLLEAMRAGLPVVATDIPGSGVGWVNKHCVSGENVTPNDVDQLSETLEKLLKCPELRSNYSRKARLRFEQAFIQNKMTSSFLEEYSTLIVPFQREAG